MIKKDYFYTQLEMSAFINQLQKAMINFLIDFKSHRNEIPTSRNIETVFIKWLQGWNLHYSTVSLALRFNIDVKNATVTAKPEGLTGPNHVIVDKDDLKQT